MTLTWNRKLKTILISFSSKLLLSCNIIYFRISFKEIIQGWSKVSLFSVCVNARYSLCICDLWHYALMFHIEVMCHYTLKRNNWWCFALLFSRLRLFMFCTLIGSTQDLRRYALNMYFSLLHNQTSHSCTFKFHLVKVRCARDDCYDDRLTIIITLVFSTMYLYIFQFYSDAQIIVD